MPQATLDLGLGKLYVVLREDYGLCSQADMVPLLVLFLRAV